MFESFSFTVPLSHLSWLPEMAVAALSGDPVFGGVDRLLTEVWCAEPGERHWHPGQDVSRIGHDHDGFGYHGHDLCPMTGAPGRATPPEEWGNVPL